MELKSEAHVTSFCLILKVTCLNQSSNFSAPTGSIVLSFKGSPDSQTMRTSDWEVGESTEAQKSHQQKIQSVVQLVPGSKKNPALPATFSSVVLRVSLGRKGCMECSAAIAAWQTDCPLVNFMNETSDKNTLT